MQVILTNNPADRGEQLVSSQQDCVCDCDCACPVEGELAPVLSRPVAYYLELTPACNNRCPGCGNVYADERKSSASPLNGRQWHELIARLAPHAQQFKLTGGEATLHPALHEILRAIDDRAIPFTLFTNGRWPQPGPLLRRLRDTATCEGLLVSLHGPDAATHETFSGLPGSFDETVTNLRRATKAGLGVAISMVITRHNWDRVASTLELALRLGANHLVCNRFIGPPLAGLSPLPSHLRAAMASVASLRAKGRPVRWGNCIPQCFQASSARGCSAGRTFATIDPWGRLRPCNHAPLIAGDLRTQSLEDVWHGSVMANWRALVPEDCGACPAFTICHGGCRAQGLLGGKTQDPLMSSAPPEAWTPPQPPAPELMLYAGLRPVGRFDRRVEKGIDLLLHRGHVVTVPRHHAALVTGLDGSLTLRQIETEHGPAALDWVGALHQAGMVSWSHPISPGRRTERDANDAQS